MELLSHIDWDADQTAASGECELSLAWAAGFADGEGCIHIAKQQMPGRRNPTYRLRFTVCQSNREVLEDFQTRLGERAYLHRTKITEKQNKQHYSLTYDGRAARDALMKLQPFLVAKRRQCDAALRFMAECDVHRHTGPGGQSAEIWKLRQSFYKKLQRLK